MRTPVVRVCVFVRALCACVRGQVLPAWVRASPECRTFLGLLLRRNPLMRISFQEFFASPFLTAPEVELEGDGDLGPPMSAVRCMVLMVVGGRLGWVGVGGGGRVGVGVGVGWGWGWDGGGGGGVGVVGVGWGWGRV